MATPTPTLARASRRRNASAPSVQPAATRRTPTIPRSSPSPRSVRRSTRRARRWAHLTTSSRKVPMSTSISQLVNTGQSSTPAASSTSTASSAISESEFLTLLTTQLQNQDPLNPMDNTQSVAELAQFSALQSQTQLASNFQTFQSNFAVMQSAGLIGQSVSAQYTDANGNVQTVSGTVQTVSVVNGSPEFTLMGSNGSLLTDANGNTLLIPTTSILSIGAASTSTSGSTTGG